MRGAARTNVIRLTFAVDFPSIRIQGVCVMKVLIVDHSGTMRTIQKRSLRKLGITDVVEAEDGVQALQHFKRHKFDVVLSDWNMPHMDGLQLLKEIRQQNQHIPVIMVTTESDRDHVVTAIEAGVSDYLVKPFTPEVLKAKLEKWMSIAQ